MKTLPDTVAAYSRSPIFTEDTVPEAFLRDHSTKPGVWGVIRVETGRLRYRIASTGEETILTPEKPGIVEPECVHSVEPLGEVRFQIEFHR